jgi:hypothetical protein
MIDGDLYQAGAVMFESEPGGAMQLKALHDNPVGRDLANQRAA